MASASASGWAGPRERVDRIEVRWIGGGIDVVRDVPADQLVTITEETR